MKTSLRGVSVALGLLLLSTGFALAQQEDVAGSKDHPLVSRYPGSRISEYSVRDFDEYELLLGKLKERVYEKSLRLEGKVTSFAYDNPEGRSVLEIFRNYEMALKQAGFQILFTCRDALCGEGARFHRGAVWDPGYLLRYLAAKLTRPEGDAYVSLAVASQGPGFQVWTELDVIEVKPMEAGLVTVDAASLARDIARTGHVAVYGIYFDFGKADVKPESEPVLKEIAKLLQQDPKLKLHLVGHTDSVGELAFNMDLSRRRATAVAQVLATKHRIAPARLRGDGVGPLAPVASNDTEEGRAKNRRVELVKQ